MAFVLDVSVVAPLVLPDENHPMAELAFERMHREEAIVPEIWRYELGNVLVSNERRRRLLADESDRFLERISRCPLLYDRECDDSMTLALARRYGLTFYDAAYLEIAVRRNIPLATLDRELAEAARKAGVEVLGA